MKTTTLTAQETKDLHEDVKMLSITFFDNLMVTGLKSLEGKTVTKKQTIQLMKSILKDGLRTISEFKKSELEYFPPMPAEDKLIAEEPVFRNYVEEVFVWSI